VRMPLLMVLFSQGVDQDIRNFVTVDICKVIEDMRCLSCIIAEYSCKICRKSVEACWTRQLTI
jgi:hypothetical protein